MLGLQWVQSAICYLASGSADCTLSCCGTGMRNRSLLPAITTSKSAGETPSPRAILTGHDAEICSMCVSAEHGLIISGPKGHPHCDHSVECWNNCLTDGLVLLLTTQGDLLRRQCIPAVEKPHRAEPGLMLMTRDCCVLIVYGKKFAVVTQRADDCSTPPSSTCTSRWATLP